MRPSCRVIAECKPGNLSEPAAGVGSLCKHEACLLYYLTWSEKKDVVRQEEEAGKTDQATDIVQSDGRAVREGNIKGGGEHKAAGNHHCKKRKRFIKRNIHLYG